MEYVWPSKVLADGTPLEEILEEDSMTESVAYAENFLKTAEVGDKFQFMRKGYYCLDKDTNKNEGKYIFNNTISLKDGFKA